MRFFDFVSLQEHFE